MTRSSEMIRSFPPASLAVMLLCCGVYACQLAFDPNVRNYTLCARSIVHLNEYYRFITSALFHANLMHIGMNMLSTAAISTMLERRFGTLRHALTVLWAILLVPFVHTTIAVLAYQLCGIDKLMYQHSLGFSGVIFHMSVLEANLTPNRTRSVFGFVAVPSFLYPWALLVALQVLMPNLSFLGHLSGIVTGTLQLYGVFDVIMVSEEYLHHMETWTILKVITNMPTFVKTPVSLETGTLLRRDPASLRRAVSSGIGLVCKFVRDVAETLTYCIFGSGWEANSNIQLPSLGRQSQLPTLDAIDTEDDDWVGLPPMPTPDPTLESRMV